MRRTYLCGGIFIWPTYQNSLHSTSAFQNCHFFKKQNRSDIQPDINMSKLSWNKLNVATSIPPLLKRDSCAGVFL